METGERVPSPRLAVLLAIACAGLVCGDPAKAGEPSDERLARPFPPSAMGPDGRIHVSRDATLGNLVVDQYSSFGRRLLAPGANADAVAGALESVMCTREGVNAVAAIAVRDAWNDLSGADRSRLKGGDPDSLAHFSATVVAQLDRVSADDVRADEALGPGVYHEAITAVRFALQVCDLL